MTTTALDTLPILNFAPVIAALPRHPGAQVQPRRAQERWITLHYSGVVYRDRSREIETQRIVSEAQYHLRRKWGGKSAIYGSRYQYDFVVLTDGAIIRCQPDRAILWHCGNKTGNEESWSVHVMTGAGQELSAPQRASLFTLFDALRADGAIPRERVVGHCEWPRGNGDARPADVYWRQKSQSECPGTTLHAELVRYRKLPGT